MSSIPNNIFLYWFNNLIIAEIRSYSAAFAEIFVQICKLFSRELEIYKKTNVGVLIETHCIIVTRQPMNVLYPPCCCRQLLGQPIITVLCFIPPSPAP